MYLLWTLAMVFLRGKARRIIACIGVVLALALIYLFTIHGRTSKASYDCKLIPFISFRLATKQPELYRAMFMNFLLFLPLGLSLPFALPSAFRHKALFSLLAGLIITVSVETMQYFLRLGSFETDDIMMNTLGTAIGVTSFLIVLLIDRLRSKSGNHFR